MLEPHGENLKEKASEVAKKTSTTTRGRPKGSKHQDRAHGDRVAGVDAPADVTSSPSGGAG